LEEEDNEVYLNQSVEELISVLHRIHCDNSRLQYYAKDTNGSHISIMPLTPFIYEYFLYNSIYQVNWAQSGEVSGIVYHSEELNESQKQRSLLKHLKEYSKREPENLYRAFEQIATIGKCEGEWTRVTPDSRISIVEGQKFFHKVSQLQSILNECNEPSDMLTSKKVFELLEGCSYYIYLVRNNIFHGSKTLGDIYERNQKQRIEVYDLFLKGLTSLFFLANGKPTAACDFVPCPIYSLSLPTMMAGEVLDQSMVLSATSSKLMKEGDSRLIFRFTKAIPPPSLDNIPKNNHSLFYPSASTDFATPLILGLPYCTQFYFFEQNKNARPPNSIIKFLDDICKMNNSIERPQWRHTTERHYLDFTFNGLQRRVHWVHADNLEFLKEEVELRFYFHRGDSIGEGGSDQKWDSKLLPSLLKMVPLNSFCLYLTDGEPGGFNENYSTEINRLNIPFIERGRKYYCGKFNPIS